MSYNLRRAVKVDGTNDWFTVATPEYDSPTYNLGTMFRKCMNWDFEQGKYYRVDEVIDNIIHGICELIDNEREYLEYNPPNGWGDTKFALHALRSLLECITDTTNIVPMKHLWVAW